MYNRRRGGGSTGGFLEWLLQATVKVAVGVSVGLVLGLFYLFKALLQNSAVAKVAHTAAGDTGGASVNSTSGGGTSGGGSYEPERDLHQARHRVKVDTRINRPIETAKSRVEARRKMPDIHKGWFRTAFGAFWAFMGVIALAMSATGGTVEPWMILVFLLPGCSSLYSGITSRRDNRRYASHLKRIGDLETISREELAAIVGCTDAQAEKDLRKMAASGFLGETAYYNDQYERLFLSHAAERAWLENRQDVRPGEGTGRAKQKDGGEAPKAPKEAEEGYSGILRQIRRTNEQISDPVLSGKVNQLIDITGRIFKAVEEDPAKEKQIDTLLNYYLPTTQKLLDSYVQFESAGVEGENLSQAKARISGTMDMVLKGFSHQLDELYRGDAMDIDSDIRVMESMLRRDVGSVADDFGLGGGAAARMPKDE